MKDDLSVLQQSFKYFSDANGIYKNVLDIKNFGFPISFTIAQLFPN